MVLINNEEFNCVHLEYLKKGDIIYSDKEGDSYIVKESVFEDENFRKTDSCVKCVFYDRTYCSLGTLFSSSFIKCFKNTRIYFDVLPYEEV